MERSEGEVLRLSEAGSQAPGTTYAQTYLALLPRLRIHGRRRARSALAVAILVLLIELPFAWWRLRLLIDGLHSFNIGDFLVFLPLLQIGVIAICLRQPKLNEWGQQSLTEQLEHSGVALRLARGDYEQDSIFEYTPPMYRWLLPRSNRRDRHWITLLRIATNLDWYLGPPRKYIRHEWNIIQSFLPLLMLGSVALGVPFLIGAGNLMTGTIIAMLLCVLSMVSLFSCSSSIQQNLRSQGIAACFASELTALLADTDPQGEEAAAGQTQAFSLDAADRSTKMLMVLNQLEQDLLIPGRMGTGQATLALMTPLLAWRILQPGLPANGPVFVPIIVVVWLPLMLIPLAISSRYKRGYALRLRSELAGASLATRLASGELKDDAIYAYTHPLLRFLLERPRSPRAYADELRRVLWRVAFNLEWYLRPPRPYFRLVWLYVGINWLFWLICLSLPVFDLITVFNSPLSGVLPPPQLPLLGALKAGLPSLVPLMAGGLCLATLIAIESRKVEAWTEELPRYLRSVIANDD